MAKRPTRSQQLGALIFDAVLQARIQWNEYAGAVVDHYHAAVEPMDRVVDFHVASSAAGFDKAQRLNTQTVRRMLSGEIRMCVDVEESLIAALPSAQADTVRSALLARTGLLLARTPPAAGDLAGQMGTPCQLLRSTAEAVEKIMPMLEDGNGIGPEDAPHFAEALNGINQVMGACITINAQIAVAMGAAPTPRAALKAVN